VTREQIIAAEVVRLQTQEQPKIRSFFEFFTTATDPDGFTINADKLQPYSFNLVNTGAADIEQGGNTIIKGSNQNDQNNLPFPRVGIYKRTDVLKFTWGAGNGMAYVRYEIDISESLVTKKD